MDFKEKLQSIANTEIYTEYKYFPSLSIPQIVFSSPEDEVRELKKKEVLRHLKISQITGEDLSADDPDELLACGWATRSAEMKVLETKLKFLNLKKEKFTSWKDAYSLVIKKLDELTSTRQIWFEEGKYFPNWKPGDGELVSRIAISANIIAHQSRIGPGNVAIIGSSVPKKLDLNLWSEFKPRFEIIIDYNIDPNKVIVLRTSKVMRREVNSCVMAVVYGDGEGDFFWGLPENWEQFASWFWIED